VSDGFRDRFEWRSRTQRQRGERMAQIVNPDRWDSRSRDEREEVAPQVGWVDRFTVPGREDEVVVLPEGSKLTSLLVLMYTMVIGV